MWNSHKNNIIYIISIQIKIYFSNKIFLIWLFMNCIKYIYIFPNIQLWRQSYWYSNKIRYGLFILMFFAIRIRYIYDIYLIYCALKHQRAKNDIYKIFHIFFNLIKRKIHRNLFFTQIPMTIPKTMKTKIYSDQTIKHIDKIYNKTKIPKELTFYLG